MTPAADVQPAIEAASRLTMTPTEPSILTAMKLDAWQGLSVDIFRAVSHEARDRHSTNACVAMILRGRSRASIYSQGKHWSFSPTPGYVGLFAPVMHIDHCRWDCDGEGQRLLVELDLSRLEVDGSLDAM